MRLIDADVLQAKFEKLREKDTHATGVNAYDLCVMLTEDAPTIEAAPVVHGSWKLKYGDEGAHWYCSNCQEEALFDIFNYQEKSKYCPNCGAKMTKRN